ncbi:hypothetical protein [Prochlorococcus sp. MIT 1223]|uniref:hypothetical protein n=1 Tax=Prochlorococcus sp. MIT 1223 TaxID=3096217 RepID=UPI002A74C2D0|nr:hypothetical protein [Prochlorococcus sp. MIT 1223]
MLGSPEFIDAEKAMGRGDYRQCLLLLEELSKQHPESSQEGARIRMLMVTAWMGQGHETKAIKTCKQLTKVSDPEIRQEAKQLISILEAPSLPRPESWSIKIPNIDFESNKWSDHSKREKRIKPKVTPSYPPTGTTKAFDMGFATAFMLLIFVLIIFLSL